MGKFVFCGSLFFLLFTSCMGTGMKFTHRRQPNPDIAISYFEENIGPAKECANQIMRGMAKKEGHITLQWTVNDKGEVLEPMVTENTLGEGAIGDCFLNLLRRLKFPPTPLLTKITVLYTLKYLPAK